MRILIILTFAGVLWGTPMLELDVPFEPNSVREDSVGPETPGVEWGLEPISSPVDQSPFVQFEPIEQAFLADLPLDVSLESFRVAAAGSQRVALQGLSGHLPLTDAGAILLLGAGLHLMLVLAGVVVGRLRFRLFSTTKIRISPAAQYAATKALESDLNRRQPAFHHDSSGAYPMRSRLE